MKQDERHIIVEELMELLKEDKTLELLTRWTSLVINGEFPDFEGAVEDLRYVEHAPKVCFSTRRNDMVIVDPELALHAIKCGYLLDVSAYEHEVVLIEVSDRKRAYSSDFGVSELSTPYASYRLRYRKNVEELNRKVDFTPEE